MGGESSVAAALSLAAGGRQEAGGGTASNWRHFRYFLLTGILVAAAGGVLLSGYFAPIPIVTRGFQFTFSLAELGLRRGWHQVPPMGPEYALSIALFAGVLLLGLVRAPFLVPLRLPVGGDVFARQPAES